MRAVSPPLPAGDDIDSPRARAARRHRRAAAAGGAGRPRGARAASSTSCRPNRAGSRFFTSPSRRTRSSTACLRFDRPARSADADRASPASAAICGRSPSASYIAVNDAIAEVAFAVDDRVPGQGPGHDPARTAGGDRRRATDSSGSRRATLRRQPRDARGVPRIGLRDPIEVRARRASNVQLSLDADRRVGATPPSERDALATAASLRPLLAPHAVAVVGASRDAPAASAVACSTRCRAAASPGRSTRSTRTPTRSTACGATRRSRDAPHGIDLAVVAVPRQPVLGVVDDCAAAGVKSLVVITAGFAEAGDDGRALQQALVERCAATACGWSGRTAWACSTPTGERPPERVVLADRAADRPRRAARRRAARSAWRSWSSPASGSVGLSTFVSVGNKADVSGNDLLAVLGSRSRRPRVILLYLESFGNPRRFARLARRIGRTKPIVARQGRPHQRRRRAPPAAIPPRSPRATRRSTRCSSSRASSAPTPSTRCSTSPPASTRSRCPPGAAWRSSPTPADPGILAVDACEAAGLHGRRRSRAATRARLAAFCRPEASVGNPVDMVASAGPEEYRRAIEVALTAGEVDALIVIYTPVDPTYSRRDAGGDSRRHRRRTRAPVAPAKPVLACLMAGDAAGRSRSIVARRERVPAYAFPENAARALGKVAAYAEWRAQPPALFWSFDDIRADEARERLPRGDRRRGERWLTGDETATRARRVRPAAGRRRARADRADEAAALGARPRIPGRGQAVGSRACCTRPTSAASA